MNIYEGKYNKAYVMLDSIDETTTSQIYSFLNNVAFKDSHIAIMPDCHAGIGSCIGYTATMTNYIIPNIIGVDIGCGVSAIKIGKINISFENLDRFIRQNIPFSFNKRDRIHSLASKNSKLIEDINTVAKEIGDKDTPHTKALGTLGGGNHYCEVGKDSNNELWVSVHSGSRNFGHKVAFYYQKIAKSLQLKGSQNNLEYLDEENKIKYIEAMKVAQRFATVNRFIMLYDVCKFLKVEYKETDIINSVHNYINFEDNIVRKGAISAHKDEILVIPLNMRDGLILAKGKGNKDWNYSAPHGAGRIYSRSKAKKELDLEEFKKEMGGIWTSCVSQKILDESPMAYKNKDLILNAIKDTVDTTDIIKPLYNFKG